MAREIRPIEVSPEEVSEPCVTSGTYRATAWKKLRTRPRGKCFAECFYEGRLWWRRWLVLDDAPDDDINALEQIGCEEHAVGIRECGREG